jgi:hypothetical protein
MMRLHNSKFFGVLLGISMIADAHAATFTLDRDVVEAGGTMVFSITTELVGTPEEPAAGTELANSLIFNGPSCNNWIYFIGSYGRDYELPYPNLPHPATSWWGGGCTALKPGSYLARFDYYRLTGSFPPSTQHYIELPFTVIAPFEVTPTRIPVDETVTISAELAPDERASLIVTCPRDFSVTFEELTDDFSVSWPGPLFDTNCDSSRPGEYSVNLVTGTRNDRESFWVYGDRDGDGLLDPEDNCPNDPNADQADADGDDQGDVCDPDDDGDGVNDETDNCPALANTSQDDLDDDNLGNACDPDLDGDGIANESDNCPNVANPEQQEACVPDPDDTDGDGQPNLTDNCPDAFNPGQQDPDGDGIGSACDFDVDGDGLDNDDEAAAGTDPLVPDDTLDENDITTLWAGTVIEGADVIEDGEIVGVVIDADPDVENASIRVIDPVGSPYLLRDFLGLTPFAFAFVPVLPGEWTIEALLGNGTLQTAVIHVIPEPDAALGGLAGAAALLGVAAARRSN